jgi:fumarate hydratase subunit beta
MAEYELKLPVDEEKARQLKVKDMVYVTGEVYTVRDMAYERILKALRSGDALPFDLTKRAVWHCGPVTKPEGDRWLPVSVGSTTSSRFTYPVSQIIEKLGVRLLIGKGRMGPEVSSAMSRYGAAYVITTGGTAAYYASQIEEIFEVHWLDLGMPAAVWGFKVKRMGPLIVGMDSHGGNLLDERTAQVDVSLSRIYSEFGIDPDHKYIWWP